ncbi:MAG: zinc-ribbon domain-containing protein [Oscillospiraceae bacterium]|nr:zinc-ribbon domain-containing protein [Oscillospiraceae bacterium]
MSKFCSQCGAALPEGARFCTSCGRAVESAPEPQVLRAPNLPQPGFSKRVNDPEILAAVKKNRRAAGVFAFFLVPLPLIGFYIYSRFSDSMETADALKYGLIISAVFLAFALFGFIRDRAANSYEATVTDKKTARVRRHSNSGSNSGDYMTEYTTYARTTDGKIKKIVEHDGSQIWAYSYLNVGDRFMYHPQFAFPYELYDKAKAPYIACVACGTHNPVTADRCKKCNVPLLK